MAKDGHGLEEALESLLGVPVDVEESPPRRYALHEIPHLAGPPEESAVAVYVRSSGVLCSSILLILPPSSARRIGDLMLGAGAPSEDVLDACRELGNIVASRYLSQVADQKGGQAVPTPPFSTVDMAGAVIASALQSAGLDPEIHAIELRLQAEGTVMRGTLLILQDQTSEASAY